MEGGRYWLFREKLIEFFGCLESNHIEPIIVMDGPDFRNTLSEKEIMRFKKRERKNQVIAEWVVHDKESKNACDSPTPILTFGIFSTVMKELGVEVFAAKGEADQDTVAIANYYNYPVLANDSDYYMYDIMAGYIPLTHLDWRARPFKLEIYKLCDFNSQFGLTDPQLSRVIPAVLGNDFIKSDLMDRLTEGGVISTENYRQVGSLVRFISKVNDVQQLMAHIRQYMVIREEIADALRAQIKQAAEMYDGIEPLSKEELQAKSSLVPDSGNGGKFPNCWLVQDAGHRFLMRIAIAGKNLPRCVIDDPHKPTARLASAGIRQSMYTMMLPLMKENRVIERLRNQLREGGKIEEIDHKVIVSPSPTLPSVLDIEGMSPDEKLSVFCHVLGIDCNILDGFDNQWKLVVAAACYWVKECRPNEVLVKAIVATFVQCSRIQPGAASPEINKRVLENLPQHISHTNSWLDALHSFTCFQCIFIDTGILNKLLQGCLDDTLCPAFFFDGKFALTYVCTDKLVSTVDEKIIPDPLYRKMFETLMEFL